MLSKKWKENYSLCARGALSNNGNLFGSRSVYSQTKSMYICLLNCKLQNISFGCDWGKLLLNVTAESQKEEHFKAAEVPAGDAPVLALAVLRVRQLRPLFSRCSHWRPRQRAAFSHLSAFCHPRSSRSHNPIPPSKRGHFAKHDLCLLCVAWVSSSGLNSSHQLSDVDPYLRFLLTPPPPPPRY